MMADSFDKVSTKSFPGTPDRLLRAVPVESCPGTAEANQREHNRMIPFWERGLESGQRSEPSLSSDFPLGPGCSLYLSEFRSEGGDPAAGGTLRDCRSAPSITPWLVCRAPSGVLPD